MEHVHELLISSFKRVDNVHARIALLIYTLRRSPELSLKASIVKSPKFESYPLLASILHFIDYLVLAYTNLTERVAYGAC